MIIYDRFNMTLLLKAKIFIILTIKVIRLIDIKEMERDYLHILILRLLSMLASKQCQMLMTIHYKISINLE
jgi:hypothetical protein